MISDATAWTDGFVIPIFRKVVRVASKQNRTKRGLGIRRMEGNGPYTDLNAYKLLVYGPKSLRRKESALSITGMQFLLVNALHFLAISSLIYLLVVLRGSSSPSRRKRHDLHTQIYPRYTIGVEKIGALVLPR